MAEKSEKGKSEDLAESSEKTGVEEAVSEMEEDENPNGFSEVDDLEEKTKEIETIQELDKFTDFMSGSSEIVEVPRVHSPVLEQEHEMLQTGVRTISLEPEEGEEEKIEYKIADNKMYQEAYVSHAGEGEAALRGDFVQQADAQIHTPSTFTSRNVARPVHMPDMQQQSSADEAVRPNYDIGVQNQDSKDAIFKAEQKKYRLHK